MTIGQRMKNTREELSLTQSDVAKCVGVATQTIFKYENEIVTNIPLDKIEKIAIALNTTPSYLMGWEDKNTADCGKYSLNPIKTKKIPMLGDIACGQPITANREYEIFIDVNSDIDVDFCLTAKGDSMINARIFDGDIVFIKKQPNVNNGEIAAIRIGDDVTLKRVYKYNNRLELRAENPLYQPLNYEEYQLDDVEILGKAIFFQSLVR